MGKYAVEQFNKAYSSIWYNLKESEEGSKLLGNLHERSVKYLGASAHSVLKNKEKGLKLNHLELINIYDEIREFILKKGDKNVSSLAKGPEFVEGLAGYVFRSIMEKRAR